MEALSPTTGIGTARAINNRQQVIGDGRVATLHLAPGNSPPVATTNGPYSGLRRSAVLLDLAGADNDDVAFVYNVSFGDGSDWTDINPPRSHTYTENGTYTLTLTVRDRRGATDTKTTTVTIANVAPTIVAGSLGTGPTAPVQMAGGSASAPIAFEFTDPGRSNDIYSAEVACGNGVGADGDEHSRDRRVPGQRRVHGQGHVRRRLHVHEPRCLHGGATVFDDAGGTSESAFYRYVIVFDPEGAFTIGSGFYSVPGLDNDKAHFSFSARYVPDDAMPNGNAKIWVPNGQADFESTAIELLVASGNRAQFWGTGTLNGAAARFRITAVDGQEGGHGRGADAIRIEALGRDRRARVRQPAWCPPGRAGNPADRRRQHRGPPRLTDFTEVRPMRSTAPLASPA